MMNGLGLHRLTIKDAQGATLVSDVSLDLPRGSVLTVIGETGSGKSLVAQALFGLLPAGMRATGHIRIGESTPVPVSDHQALARHWRKTMMLIPQEPGLALDPTMRVGRQLALAGIPENAIADALGAVDMPASVADAYPFMLSGGMAQRVTVAIALATGSPVLVADEPTKGMDAQRIGQAIGLFRRVAARGHSLMLITHDLAVARAMPGTVVVLREGRLVEEGPGDAVLTSPRSCYARELLAADPATWPRKPHNPATGPLLLAAHDVAFSWQGKQPMAAPLFRNIQMHVRAGGVVAVAGPSGCGKTTLGNVLLGLLRPAQGHVRWGTHDPHGDPAAKARLRQRYQKLHQDPMTAFAPHSTIGVQLAMLRKLRPGLELAARLPALLESLKLAPALLKRLPSALSGGEAQRLALARILLLDPAVIVADEPTSRLDPIVQRETMALLRACVDERKMGLVIISHDFGLMGAMADDVLTMADATTQTSTSPFEEIAA